MAVIQRSLGNLRNRRDLRAEILTLAADLLADPHATGQLVVEAPAVSEATVRDEWDRLLPAIAPRVRSRMRLTVPPIAKSAAKTAPRAGSASPQVPVGRPNYRYETIRQLVAARFDDDGPVSIKTMVDAIGASQTPIRHAMSDLQQAGLVHAWGRGFTVDIDVLSAESLSKVGAQPQKLAFRFERGARIKPPDALLTRVLPLLGSTDAEGSWWTMALSGVAAARADVPKLDLIGMPRLDLVTAAPREVGTFEADALRRLDDGLEPEPSVLAPSVVVVTLVRARSVATRDVGREQIRYAHPADVFLSLLDMGLREQAMQYARAMR